MRVTIMKAPKSEVLEEEAEPIHKLKTWTKNHHPMRKILKMSWALLHLLLSGILLLLLVSSSVLFGTTSQFGCP